MIDTLQVRHGRQELADNPGIQLAASSYSSYDKSGKRDLRLERIHHESSPTHPFEECGLSPMQSSAKTWAALSLDLNVVASKKTEVCVVYSAG